MRCTQEAPAPASALDDALDALQARLTIPTDRVGTRVQVGGTERPAADPDLWATHIRYARHNRDEDREILIGAYLHQARALARRLYRGRDPIEDLEQVAYEALLLSIDRFDPGRGMPFLAYATPTILGSLKRYYRDCGWGVRVPRRVHDLSRPLRDAWEELSQEMGRTPSSGELAESLDLTEADVHAALDAEAARTTGSLDAMTIDDAGGADHILGRRDPSIDRVIDLHAVEQVLDLLDGDDRELLRLYFDEDLTQAEIAEKLGVSQMQVSRALRRVLRQMRSHLPAA